MTIGLFVTGTGTNVGKTYVTRGLAAAARSAGRSVIALKPIETGCDPLPNDAIAIANACGNANLASLPELYRARPPLSPYAVTLATQAPPPNIDVLVQRIDSFRSTADLLLVEGAGGLLTPLTERTTIADLAVALRLPLLVVAANELGALSHTLAVVECAQRRQLDVATIVLVNTRSIADSSAALNPRILADQTHISILEFPYTSNDDALLAQAAKAAGLLQLLQR